MNLEEQLINRKKQALIYLDQKIKTYKQEKPINEMNDSELLIFCQNEWDKLQYITIKESLNPNKVFYLEPGEWQERPSTVEDAIRFKEFFGKFWQNDTKSD